MVTESESAIEGNAGCNGEGYEAFVDWYWSRRALALRVLAALEREPE
jgi:hypothetical protein